MAKKLKTDNPGNDRVDDLEYKSFHEFLYKNRLLWTKHIIPIRFIDPDIKVFIEGYIIGSINKQNKITEEIEHEDQEKYLELEFENEDQEEVFSKNTIVKVRTAHLSPFCISVFDIRMGDIYPSTRKLTIIPKDSRTILGKEVTLVSLYNSMEKFSPNFNIPVESLMEVFKKYKGIHWTKAEMASIVNRPLEDIENYIKNGHLEVSSKRICKITNSEEDTYKAKEVKIEKMINLDKDHKVVSSLDDLYKNYSNCTKCELGNKRILRNCNIVPSRGNSNKPKFMFLGEAPGVQEEEEGIPFNPKAPAGKILIDMLMTAGFDKKDCFITNTVLCRPPAEESEKGNNAKPKNEYIVACSSRLKNEIAIVNPKIIVLLGKSAYRAFFGKDPENVINNIGWIIKNKVYFVPHPSYIARQANMPAGKVALANYLACFKEILNSE